MVVRPRSRSLAVAQGKGLDVLAATASGLMESIESWHAERILPQRLTSYSELDAVEHVIDVQDLPPRQQTQFHEHLEIPWVCGVDLMDEDREIWVPYALVHSNYSVPPPSGAGCFCSSTNGLASGNTLDEALIHGITELIERDAMAIWHHRSAFERAATLIDPSTIDDSDAVRLLELFETADMAVSVFDATSDVQVPVFHAEITERGQKKPFFFPRTVSGDGCHPTRNIALLRSLTEAAQSRLTFISGARDDILEDDYNPIHNVLSGHGSCKEDPPLGTIHYHSVPNFETDDLRNDLHHLLDRLANIGVTQVAAVDLSHVEPERIRVARIVIPGLATGVDHPKAAHWSRLPARSRPSIRLSSEAMM